MSKNVSPSQDRLMELLAYNPETGIFHWKKTRNLKAKSGEQAGSLNNGYVIIRIDMVAYRAHRLAWQYIHGKPPKQQIDHINQNRSDNRISNLRECSNQENSKNQKLRSTNTSGHVGVYRDKKKNVWRPSICVNRKNISLGSFAEISDAIIARKKAEVAHGYHPNHGNTPIPETKEPEGS